MDVSISMTPVQILLDENVTRYRKNFWCTSRDSYCLICNFLSSALIVYIHPWLRPDTPAAAALGKPLFLAPGFFWAEPRVGCRAGSNPGLPYSRPAH